MGDWTFIKRSDLGVCVTSHIAILETLGMEGTPEK